MWVRANWLAANFNSLPRDPIPFSFVPSLNTKAHHYSNELGAALAAACTDGAPTRVLQLLAAGAAPGWRRAIPDESEGGSGGEVGGEERRTCIEQARASGQWGCAALLDQAQAAIFGLAAPDESEIGTETEACLAQDMLSSESSPKSSSPGSPDDKEDVDALYSSYLSSVGTRPPLRRAAGGGSGATAHRAAAWRGAPVAADSEPAPQPTPQPVASGSGSWGGGRSGGWLSPTPGVQKKSGLSPVREEAEEEEEEASPVAAQPPPPPPPRRLPAATAPGRGPASPPALPASPPAPPVASEAVEAAEAAEVQAAQAVAQAATKWKAAAEMKVAAQAATDVHVAAKMKVAAQAAARAAAEAVAQAGVEVQAAAAAAARLDLAQEHARQEHEPEQHSPQPSSAHQHDELCDEGFSSPAPAPPPPPPPRRRPPPAALPAAASAAATAATTLCTLCSAASPTSSGGIQSPDSDSILPGSPHMPSPGRGATAILLRTSCELKDARLQSPPPPPSPRLSPHTVGAASAFEPSPETAQLLRDLARSPAISRELSPESIDIIAKLDPDDTYSPAPPCTPGGFVSLFPGWTLSLASPLTLAPPPTTPKRALRSDDAAAAAATAAAAAAAVAAAAAAAAASPSAEDPVCSVTRVDRSPKEYRCLEPDRKKKKCPAKQPTELSPDSDGESEGEDSEDKGEDDGEAEAETKGCRCPFADGHPWVTVCERGRKSWSTRCGYCKDPAKADDKKHQTNFVGELNHHNTSPGACPAKLLVDFVEAATEKAKEGEDGFTFATGPDGKPDYEHVLMEQTSLHKLKPLLKVLEKVPQVSVKVRRARFEPSQAQRLTS